MLLTLIKRASNRLFKEEKMFIIQISFAQLPYISL